MPVELFLPEPYPEAPDTAMPGQLEMVTHYFITLEAALQEVN